MTRIDPLPRFPLLLFAVLGLAACDDVVAPGLDDEMVRDAALLAADATLEEVTMWSQPLFGPSPTAGSPAGERLSEYGRPGGHGSFTGEFSGTRSVTFYDADGVEQDAYDPITTESIHFLRGIRGAITRDDFSASVVRERDLTVSGLAGEETVRIWNGTGSSEVERSGVLADGTERAHSIVGATTYEEIVVPIPGTEPRYPLSGTITHVMTITRTTPDGTETKTVTIVITFDGSSTATAVVNGETIEIDLSARAGRNPIRGFGR